MKNVKDVKVYRGADIDSDHFMVKAIIQEEIPLRHKKQNKKMKYKLGKLNELGIMNKFQSKIKQKLTETSTTTDIEEKWENIEDAVLFAAQILKENEDIEH